MGAILRPFFAFLATAKQVKSAPWHQRALFCPQRVAQSIYQYKAFLEPLTCRRHCTKLCGRFTLCTQCLKQSAPQVLSGL